MIDLLKGVHAATLVDQVLERRRGPTPTQADQVFDALRDVYDTCPKCGTYTGGRAHGC